MYSTRPMIDRLPGMAVFPPEMKCAYIYRRVAWRTRPANHPGRALRADGLIKPCVVSSCSVGICVYFAMRFTATYERSI